MSIEGKDFLERGSRGFPQSCGLAVAAFGERVGQMDTTGILNLPESVSPEGRYLLGISGGRDSVALLGLLVEAGFGDLVLCHLNHELRGDESDADAALVRDLAGELGLPVKVGNRAVSDLAQAAGLSVEAAARQARLEFFVQCAGDFGTNRVFLAHHANDQAETVLINLIRGSGSRGLGAMEPATMIQVGESELELIRPLLHVERDQIPMPPKFREDESNASNAFLRNRIRHRLIPEIENQSRRPLIPALLRTAEILGEEDRFLETVLEERFDVHQDELRVPDLRALPVALQRRAIHNWLSFLRIPNIGFEEIERVRGLIEPGAKVAKINLPADRHVRRREKRLFVEPTQ
ncbi:MAG: tRNA lysidine(34) synthetase TilS [Verrucomicrobiota bacterium]